ncbi:A-kinase anchor protein 4-like [Sceloporus undulatus]|uniref:A-kinase anchor protein 4-like n=1 Tax=Sceloporus undulatus TaxID=8520 RepID=UPI001C4C5F04|nr:A-kinase anchor protein 4-like [Sceloporus undulatus]
MSQEVDWLHSQAGVCKVDLYNPEGGKDQDRKVICFVDVSSLNIKNTDDTEKDAADQSKSNESATGLDLGKMQDKEVIVIKDSDTPEQSKTEGAVCLFKQGSTEELNVVTWLFDDLQKYACGFQHALTPSPTPPKQKPSAADKMSQNNNNTAFKSSEGQKAAADEVASTVQKLCTLVMQMASKEISENLEDAASKCIRQAIYATKDGKPLPPGSVSQVASKMVNEAMESAQEPSCKSSQDNMGKKEEGKGTPKKTSLFYGEVSSNQSESIQDDDGKPMSHAHLIHPKRQSGRNDGSSFNKGLMVYANKNAKDMTFSFVNATKIHKRQPLPACVVLKRVFLKHTKDVISDLIDSTMKNLHNVTGVLMTDSDFVTTVKKNLFHAGTQKSTEILEAMVLRMYNALTTETKEKGHSLVYSLLKTGCSLDPNSPSMHFASLKGGLHTREKVKQDAGHSAAQKVGETIIKDGISMLRSKTGGGKGSDRCHDKKPEKSNSTTEFLAKDLILTALMLIQQHLLTQYKEPVSESNTSSFGYFEKGGKHGSKSHGSKGDPQQQDYQRGEIQSALLSIIQKVLQEAGFNVDECEVSRNFKQSSYDDRSSRKSSSKQCSDVDSENMEQINKKFIDQLMESVMKLCMYMTKSPDFVVEDYSDDQATYFTARNKGVSTPDSMTCQKPPRSSNIGKPLVPAGSEVIVNNQTANTSSQNKELQAVLQWMAASHFQVPNLTFMNENDEELKKLPQLADKAAKKGASVGDILQEVMRYFEKQQVDAAVGNMPRCGLLDWLLANL